MSKSITVIQGKVWTHRSVTWNRNVASGNVLGHSEPVDDAAGDSPDDAPMCHPDKIEHGRNFTRHVRTK